MSEELDPRFSAFWPLVILLGAFAISFLYDDIGMISRRSYVNGQYVQVAQNIPKAKEAHDRLAALVDDLAKTSDKDQNALAILRWAAQNGIVRTGSSSSTNSPSSSQ